MLPLLGSRSFMKWVYDDGGRLAAGFKGLTGDCVCRAIAIATEVPYRDVYNSLNELAKRERVSKRKRGRSSARDGVYKATYHHYLLSLGWTWTPTMGIGTGCRVHLQREELPTGRLIVALSKHLVACIDHVIHDLSDPGRGGKRCVYGYYTAPGRKEDGTDAEDDQAHR